MTEKLTDDEHTARAMLLGYKYDSALNIYVWETSTDSSWLDADDLHEMDRRERAVRAMNYSFGARFSRRP